MKIINDKREDRVSEDDLFGSIPAAIGFDPFHGIDLEGMALAIPSASGVSASSDQFMDDDKNGSGTLNSQNDMPDLFSGFEMPDVDLSWHPLEQKTGFTERKQGSSADFTDGRVRQRPDDVSRRPRKRQSLIDKINGHLGSSPTGEKLEGPEEPINKEYQAEEIPEQRQEITAQSVVSQKPEQGENTADILTEAAEKIEREAVLRPETLSVQDSSVIEHAIPKGKDEIAEEPHEAQLNQVLQVHSPSLLMEKIHQAMSWFSGQKEILMSRLQKDGTASVKNDVLKNLKVPTFIGKILHSLFVLFRKGINSIRPKPSRSGLNCSLSYKYLTRDTLARANRYSEINRIREKIVHPLKAQKKKTVLIANPVDHTGGTLLISVMGYNAASSDEGSVLLVDMNMRCPQLHLPFDLAQEEGFTDIISKNINWQAAVKHTDLVNLHVITAGTPHNRLSDYLDFVFLEEILAEMAEVYDIIMVDSSPVLAQNRNNVDTVILSKICDFTYLMVKDTKTKMSDLRNAVSMIIDGEGRLSGLVYNKQDALGLDMLKNKIEKLWSFLGG